MEEQKPQTVFLIGALFGFILFCVGLWLTAKWDYHFVYAVFLGLLIKCVSVWKVTRV